VILLVVELAMPTRPWSEVLAAVRAARSSRKASSGAEPSAPSTDQGEEKADADGVKAERREEAGSSSDARAGTGAPESVGEVDESTIPADPRRWVVSAALLGLVFGNDLYYYIPANFFPGEADRAGLGMVFVGFYIGFGGLSGALSVLLGTWLTQYMNLSDALRITIAFMAVVTIPQGLGALIHSSAWFALFELSLRFIEGFFQAIAEAVLITYVLRLFQRPSEYTLANGLLISGRTLVGAASPFVGGSIYSALGMAGPYTLTGGVILCAVFSSRFLLNNDLAAEGNGASNVPLLKLLSLPAFGACFLHSILTYAGLAFADTLYQPWLGTKDGGYNWDPDKISTVTVTFMASIAVGCATIAPLFSAQLGNGVTVLLGDAVMGLSCFFIGSPPHVFRSLTPKAWLPYVVFGSLGLGMSLNAIAFGPLMVDVLAREGGLPRSQTDATLAAAMVLPGFISTFIGPAFGGMIVEASGVSSSALGMAGFFGVCAALLLVFCTRYLHKNTDSKED